MRATLLKKSEGTKGSGVIEVQDALFHVLNSINPGEASTREFMPLASSPKFGAFRFSCACASPYDQNS